MKYLLIISIVFLTWACCQKEKCQNCYTNSLPVYNGVDEEADSSINTANIKVDTAHVDSVGKVYTLTGRIKCTASNNNASWEVKAMVFLPPQVYIKRFSSSEPKVKAYLFYG